ncbi:helicase-related protein [Nitrosospira multiformis]|uniref:helicase-related protein n=1 Tax=Nitrosospira multiformis TaxID=1231 RepID=UPI000896F6BE|nr:helicase-related protein [Nitrosospira multiformis]SEA47673.1 Helicase conserved C-terminal domain-containing protein [Nitrosospira multiformis]
MPRVFDNIDQSLLPALRDTLAVSTNADFCVGYFNLRGWRTIDDLIDEWDIESGQRCRVLIGMQRPPQDEVRALYQVLGDAGQIDNARATAIKHNFAAHLREQITFGVPSVADESGLQRLARQLRAGKVQVKLFLPYPLHAKLYLLFRQDANNPVTGFVGSSNLTFSGLSKQGELNVDVLDHDATIKLSKWFDARWHERWCLDISPELALIIEQSWARETPIPPYHIYLNMAYHLSVEARAGLSQFRLPPRFEEELFEFQKAAVKIAARHLHRRGGVLIGDVVGLGKTMMAVALARMMEDDLGYETLIICPANLVPMWQHYRREYGLRGAVVALAQVTQHGKGLKNLKRYRLVLIDESHNLRNRAGRRYKAILDYIKQCDARVVLVTATPYNKTLNDLSAQLRLFLDERANIGIRPEHFMRQNDMTVAQFERQYQCPAHSILAMEKSDVLDDWRELIRLYMVRRTRTFILQHYTEQDSVTGRRYLNVHNGEKLFFPVRQPISLDFSVDENDAADQYARLYSEEVVDVINRLHLPRYGLGRYADPVAMKSVTAAERKQMDDLGKAGKRLIGFCRTNLFKRLESSGFTFLQSIERHILRNEVYLYAINNDKELPIGTLDASVLDVDRFDEDAEGLRMEVEDLLDGMVEEAERGDFTEQAGNVYQQYVSDYYKRFKWISPRLFGNELREHLAEDVAALRNLLNLHGQWRTEQDQKLTQLKKLIAVTHGRDKVLIFTQFAGTARYLGHELQARGIRSLAVVTGASADPYVIACRFSPRSNNARIAKVDELRVLVCTDVLSEGQNLQDCAVVVNFDLPWAIIRLIQRAGRVDRIGQQAEHIRCYSFLPADGVERLIRLRARIAERLNENAEVVGTDEAFFEDEDAERLRTLSLQMAGALDDQDDEVDLASYAWQIWKTATADNPALAREIEALPPVIFSAKRLPSPPAPFPRGEGLGERAGDEGDAAGALVYVKSPEGNDHLAWVNSKGEPVTESQFTILKIAECSPDEPPLARAANHHELVAAGLKLAVSQEKAVGGGLGRPSSPRRRCYDRLMEYARGLRGTLFTDEELERAIEDIYARPLLESAADTLNRLMRSGVNDEQLADAVKSLREENLLTYVENEAVQREPKIICSLGLIPMDA